MASNSGQRSSSSGSRPSGQASVTDPYDRPSARRGGSSRQRTDDDPWGDPYGRPSAQARRARREPDPRKARYYRTVRRLITFVVLVATAFVIYLVLVYSGLFAIKSIVATPTEHITSETISSLAAVPEGSTLFNVNEQKIVEQISTNPWVKSVSVSRSFPNRLVIDVEERQPAAAVLLSSGLEAWWVSSDGFWLEQLPLQEATADNGIASPSDQARAMALTEGMVFVTDVNVATKPQAGMTCDDEAILAVLDYLSGFSQSMVDQILTAKASSVPGLSFVLASGVEVAVGAPEDIQAKEQVISALLEQYTGQITYINVRVPSSPSWRGL